MPIIDGRYVPPMWHNDTAPEIDADEMQAISDSIGLLPIVNGGTGADNAAQARVNLEITPANIGALPTTATIGIPNGGTGADNAAQARVNLEITPTNIGALPTSGNAASATKLNVPKNLKVKLDSASAQGFDGTADATSIGVSGALKIANGGTEATTAAAARTKLGITPANIGALAVGANAASATKLATGRTLKVKLDSTAASTAFNGTANVADIGVSGALKIANGGTEATTAAGARAKLGVAYASTTYEMTGITSDSSSSLAKTLYLWRFGNIVVAYFYAVGKISGANKEISCGTVPAGYRPSVKIEAIPSVLKTGTTVSGQGVWQVSTNGAIKHYATDARQMERSTVAVWYTSNTFPS